MEKTVTPCADLGMTNLVITLVMLMVTKFAWMGGKKIPTILKEIIAPKVRIDLISISFKDLDTKYF